MLAKRYNHYKSLVAFPSLNNWLEKQYQPHSCPRDVSSDYWDIIEMPLKPFEPHGPMASTGLIEPQLCRGVWASQTSDVFVLSLAWQSPGLWYNIRLIHTPTSGVTPAKIPLQIFTFTRIIIKMVWKRHISGQKLTSLQCNNNKVYSINNIK